MLEGGDAGAGRGQGVDLAEVRGHREPQRRCLVQEWRQQVGGDLRVDLDQVRPGDGTLVDRPAHLGAGAHRGRRGVGGWCAVDHGAGGEHAGPQHRAEVEVVLERDGRVGARRAEVPHRGDAPGEIALHRPPLHVSVRIDEPRYHGLPDQAHSEGAARHGDLVHAGHGLDVAVLHENHGIRHRRAARAVDQRRSLEGDHAVTGALAAGQRQDQQEAAMRDAGCGMRHFGSADVWSCRICQRAPRF